jgi:hypothetical protein
MKAANRALLTLEFKGLYRTSILKFLLKLGVLYAK